MELQLANRKVLNILSASNRLDDFLVSIPMPTQNHNLMYGTYSPCH